MKLSAKMGHPDLWLAEGVEAALGFVAEVDQVGGLFAQAFYDVRRGFADEFFVGETGLVGGEGLVEFGEVFG